MNTLIVIPLQDELDGFLQGCAKQGVHSCPATIGRLSVVTLPDYNVTLALGGLGKSQFALQTQHLIDCGSAWDLIICAGAGGGLADQLVVGDVVVGIETVEHDIYNNFGQPIVPRFEAPADVVAALRQSAASITTFHTYFGVIASGDEDVVSETRQAEIEALTGAIAVAWEGAGGARACQFSDIPFVEIRGITDGADSGAASDFTANLSKVMENVARLLMAWAQELNR